MERKLIWLVFITLFSLKSEAQLTVFPAKHDFGILSRSDPNWVDVKITNLGVKEAFIFRVEGSSAVHVQMSSKKILPDSTVYIRVQYNPGNTGPFREEIRIYASSWQLPHSFVISGESTYAVDFSLPCPDFSSVPGGTPRSIHITVVDSQTQSRITGANTVVYRDGRKYAAEVSDENGEIELNLIPGRYFISFTYERQSIDTTVYIHGFNQHLQIAILQTDLFSRIESDTKGQDILAEQSPYSPPKDESLNSDDIPKGNELSTIEFKPNNVVFLVDVSASMKNEGRIELLKIAMVELLDVLRSTDRFSLISYAAYTDVLIETKSQLDKSACREAIQNLTVSGSTEGAKAIETAGRKVLQHYIADGNNQIIIATDGAFNDGAALAKKLATKYHRKGVVISVLGIRCGKYTTSEMSELANYGGGRFVAINTPLDAVDKLVDEIKLSSRN